MPERANLTPRARRIQAQETWGRKFERWIHDAEMTVVGFAQRFGFKREKLYPIFRGEAKLPAGALWALPVEVRRLAAEDLARSCGLEVRPLSPSSSNAALTAMAECSDVVRASAEAMADGQIDPVEAEHIRTEAQEAMESLAALVATCDEVRVSRVPRAVGGSA